MVEKEWFQKLLKAFDSQYQLPNRKYFTNTAIPALYASTREKVSNSISGAKYFAATMDMWSSATSAPYMSYTVHFIDPQWSLQSWCLQTLFVPQDHDADNLADIMTETLANWVLTQLIKCVSQQTMEATLFVQLQVVLDGII